MLNAWEVWEVLSYPEILPGLLAPGPWGEAGSMQALGTVIKPWVFSLRVASAHSELMGPLCSALVAKGS